ncbi:hypothetical protein PL373_19110 [Tenacibaculum maritimum]|nr:hypothetical protein [Tenacibaculum maritimum]MDB0603199.1 hypothetical protein [Tenacibaculum maritimum]MDB0610461.1 hypothetical protein [Tenacibaculum maritimum]
MLLQPAFLRKEVSVAFIKIAISPLTAIYDDWFRIRNENLYKLAHNGQVCYLRKALNDKFDFSMRRIYISDGNSYLRKYIYTNGEQKPTYLGKIHLHSIDDYADTGVDFIVFVPTGIVAAQIYELKAFINFYKEGVKRYKIVEI